MRRKIIFHCVWFYLPYTKSSSFDIVNKKTLTFLNIIYSVSNKLCPRSTQNVVLYSVTNKLCARSTQNVPYINKANIIKECDESVRSTHRMWMFFLKWKFFKERWRHTEKAHPLTIYSIGHIQTKKKGKTPNGDYFKRMTH